MKVFVCRESYEAMMSCIYTAWQEALLAGHDNVRIEREIYVRPNLIDEFIYVEEDISKAEKVTRSVRMKISEHALEWVYKGSLSTEKDAVDAIYRFLILGFRAGGRITEMLTLQPVMHLMEIIRRVGNEAHHFLEFARFNRLDGGVYVSHLEPKNDVIFIIADHFADRMPSEHFMIIDDNRRIAAVHPKDEEVYIRKLTDQEFKRLLTTEEYEDEYTQMWRTFFDTIAIKQRINPTCQNTLFPKWKRKHATEFI